MSSFSSLKTAIANAIKANGNQEITGNLLQGILLSIVETLGDSAINTLETGLSNEATTRGNADTTLNNLITGVKNNVDNGYVYAGIATPTTNPVSGKVFYIATKAGTYTNLGGFSVTEGITILKYNGSTWSKEQVIYGDGGVFDVTAQNGGATFASLEALLGSGNLSTLIPTAVRKGGMSIKFVQTSDNKYVQFRFMLSGSFTNSQFANPINWQGIDDEPTRNSNNLPKSGGVFNSILKSPYKEPIDIVYIGSEITFADNVASIGDCILWGSNKYLYYKRGSNDFVNLGYVPKYIRFGGVIYTIDNGSLKPIDVVPLIDIYHSYTQVTFSRAGEVFYQPTNKKIFCVSYYGGNSNSYEEIIPNENSIFKYEDGLYIFDGVNGLVKVTKNIEENIDVIEGSLETLSEEVEQHEDAVNVLEKGIIYRYIGSITPAAGSSKANGKKFGNHYNNASNISISRIVVYMKANDSLIKVIVANSSKIVTDTFSVENAVAGANNIIHDFVLPANGYVLIETTDSFIRYASNTSDTSIQEAFLCQNSSPISIGDTLTTVAVSGNNVISLFPETSEIEYYDIIENYLNGKKLSVTGDSEMKGDTALHPWPELIANRNNMQYQTIASNGGRIADGSYDKERYGQPLCTTYNQIDSDADYILLQGGWNDSWDASVSDDSQDTFTFKGAFNVLIEGILSTYPSAKFAVMAIHYYYSEGYNTQNNIAKNAFMKSRCELHHIPFFDGCAVSNIDYETQAQRNMYFKEPTYGADFVHLNQAGLERMSYKYEAFMRGL